MHQKSCFTSVSVFPGERVNGSTPRGGLRTPIFDRPSDWDREIKRTGASEWRVCSINEGYAISQRFSAHVVYCWQFLMSVIGRASLRLLQLALVVTDTLNFTLCSYLGGFGKTVYLHCSCFSSLHE